MRRPWIFVLASLVSGCVRVAPGAFEKQVVVFSSERDGNTDVYIQAVDGTALRRLTVNTEPDRQPRCSPDGRSIVFVRGDGRARAIYLIDIATGVERRLTPSEAADYTPSWSPDGRRIYFTRAAGDGGFDRLAEMNTDGTAIRFLTDGTAHDVRPVASDDGEYLVYHSYRYERGNTELHVMNLKTGEVQRVTSSPALDYEATFAGSDRILFSSNRDGEYFRLYELLMPTGAVRRVLDTGHDIWGARYEGGDKVLVYTGTPARWRVLELSLTSNTAASVLDETYSNFAADRCSPRSVDR